MVEAAVGVHRRAQRSLPAAPDALVVAVVAPAAQRVRLAGVAGAQRLAARGYSQQSIKNRRQ